MAPQTSRQQTDPTAGVIEEEAIAWFVRLNGGHADDDDRSEHMDWLLADPRHIRAYEDVCDRMQTAHAAEPAARTAYAFDFLKHQPKLLGGVRSYMRTGMFWPRAAMAAAFVAIGLFFTSMPHLPFYHEAELVRQYAAPAGSALTVRLTDGSQVSLAPGTRLSVKMTAHRRTVEMGPGRAYFDVLHRVGTPFYVLTARRQVRVVGTRFEVREQGLDDTVAVAEGFVSVCRRLKDDAPKTGTNIPVLLEAGMQLHYPAGTDRPEVSSIDPMQVGAWATDTTN